MPERCYAKSASYRDDSERRFALRRRQMTTARGGVLSAEQLIQPASLTDNGGYGGNGITQRNGVTENGLSQFWLRFFVPLCFTVSSVPSDQSPPFSPRSARHALVVVLDAHALEELDGVGKR